MTTPVVSQITRSAFSLAISISAATATTCGSTTPFGSTAPTNRSSSGMTSLSQSSIDDRTFIPTHPTGPTVAAATSPSTKATVRPCSIASRSNIRARVVLPVSASPITMTTPSNPLTRSRNAVYAWSPPIWDLLGRSSARYGEFYGPCAHPQPRRRVKRLANRGSQADPDASRLTAGSNG